MTEESFLDTLRNTILQFITNIKLQSIWRHMDNGQEHYITDYRAGRPVQSPLSLVVFFPPHSSFLPLQSITDFHTCHSFVFYQCFGHVIKYNTIINLQSL